MGCVGCEKLQLDFVVRTFAIIALVQPVLRQASCSNEIVQNAPKHYEMQQYMSLGSNGMGRVHSLRNTPKHYETHTNMSLGSNGVDWVRSLRKIPERLHGTNLCINYTSSTRFPTSFV